MAGDCAGKVVIAREFRDACHVQQMAECVCFCGKSFITTLSKVKLGHTRSCGCLRAIVSRKQLTVHGMHGSREYRAWMAMKNRCLNPNADRYPSYGGRGISIDQRWRSFDAFYADMGPCPQGLTLDRIDVNSDYGPKNCRWATIQEQSENKTNTVLVVYKGEKMSLSRCAKTVGVDPKALRYRFRVKGMSLEASLSDLGIEVDQ